MRSETVLLTDEIYTSQAVEQGKSDFAQLCRVVTAGAPEGILATISFDENNSQDLLSEFLNYVLALSAEQQLA